MKMLSKFYILSNQGLNLKKKIKLWSYTRKWHKSSYVLPLNF